jgi:uncharacterized protein YoxC
MGGAVMAKTLTVFLAADLKKFNNGMRDAQRGVQGFGGTLNKMLGPALIGAGVAAAGLAVKLGVDGVKAAVEDEKAVAALATTLGNLGLAHDTRPVEDYIYQLERAYGVADTELRPAYDRLVRSTKDTEEANRALKIAMDISASTGKSLQTVTDSLGRAYDGNTVSLGRLGLGIDKTELAAMSLDQIMSRLGDTFAGQADANARTFEGQLRRLTTATDNLKEAFGAGLLQALGDTGEATDDLVDKFEAMEPSLRVAGFTVGKAFEQAAKEGAELSKVLGFMIDPSATLSYIWEDIAIDLRGGTDAMKDMQRAANDLRLEIALLGGDPLFDRLLGSPGHQQMHADALKANNFELKAANRLYQDAAARAQRLATEQSNVTRETTSVSSSSRGASSATNELTKSQQKLLEKSQKLTESFNESSTALQDQILKVQEATNAVEEYAASMQQNLLAGFDLGNLAEGAMDEQGNLSAAAFFESFDAAIAQAEWFGGLLNQLKARNVDQRLIEDIAGLGPEVGGSLAQEMLTGDGALLQTFTDKWQTIQDRTHELAMGLVPEFLEAGRQSAIDNLVGMAEQFKKDQKKFRNLGKQVGKQVGASFKKQIAEDVAAAVRQVEAAATAARAEAVARAEAQQAALTQQAVAEALSNLIRNNDQRQGRNPSPVLG